MAKKQKITNTRLAVVLDKSGSMDTMISETISGFNQFIEDQKNVEGDATLTLVQFDHNVEFSYIGLALEHVKPLNEETYVPNGWTALLDAIGMTIAKFKEEKVDKHTKTIITIITDGAENASKEYTYDAVKKMISHVEDELGWEVMFIGANINVAEVSANIGVKMHKSATYTADGVGMRGVMDAMAFAATEYRSGGELNDSHTMQAAVSELTKR